ncbi:hypothetical protein LTR78_000372 [Recurvomyces mirabilis]|uniref:Transcription factor domain-containing protein n=1 Tax=Recurvomyces mirabilis TaxID=574656 RepID=A0AAE0WX40_9PEZI|nr:hypothetical protein LTR78_000372 [Recurvomyces mirabilis]KAK5162027.1 hypothetical protein LTS14_000373 [Recurvomyces mirabilis]
MATLKALHARRVHRIMGDVPLRMGDDLPPSPAEVPPELAPAFQHGSTFQQLPPDSPFIRSDKRLARFNLAAWCPVTVPNELARRLLDFYLHTDHAVLGHFDSELFIEDLLNNNTDFCSVLLVTSLLLWACHGYSLIDQRALMLSTPLFDATLRLWQQERDHNSLTTLAAGIFFRLACTVIGNEDIGLSVFADMYDMVQRLELVGTVSDNPEAYTQLDEHERKWYRARAHAAWGLFNFTTLHSFSYGPPMMSELPKFMIPGEAYTWPLPDFMGNTFTKLSKLWLILNEVSLAYFADPSGGSPEHLSIDFAEGQYRRLLEWADMNGPLIEQWDRDSRHQSYIQVIFHTCVLELFRPFLDTNLPLKTFQWQQCTPRAIYSASTRQLHYQLLMFPIIHPSADFIWWWYGVCQIANAAITTLEKPDSQWIFLLCLVCFHDLAVCFPVMGDVLAGLLRIATRRKFLHRRDAHVLYERLRENRRMLTRQDQKGVGFSIDLSMSERGSEIASVSQLAKAS